MVTPYLLLRNNKQTGPHTLEELVQLSLQSSDLIWIEGKSTGWRTPQEIVELTPYVPEAAHLIIKSNEERNNIDNQNRRTTNSEKKETAQKETATRIHISLPAGIESTSYNGGEENAAEDRLEKKAQALFTKVHAYSNNQTEQKPDVDTRYIRPLLDIKQEYAAWIDGQKKQKSSPVTKKGVTLVILSIILIIGTFIMASWLARSTGKEQQMKQPVVVATSLPDSLINKKTPADSIISQIKLPDTQVQRIYKSAQENKVNEGIDNSKFNVESKNANSLKPILNVVQSVAQIDDSPKPAFSQEKITEIKLLPAPITTGTPVTPYEKNEKEAVPFSQLITVNGKERLPGKKEDMKNFEVTVHNNSNQVLTVVAVNVFYSGEKGNEPRKETLYFSNIQPKDSSMVIAAGAKKEVSISCQLGLIGSKQGTLYVAKY